MSNIDTGLLIVCVVLLGAILVTAVAALRRFWHPERPVEATIRAALREMDAAIRHHVTVNAVVSSIAQLRERPEAIEQLISYPRDVVAAAMLYRINCLGEQQRAACDRLTVLRSCQLGAEGSNFDADVRRVGTLVETLGQELAAARAAAEQLGIQH